MCFDEGQETYGYLRYRRREGGKEGGREDVVLDENL